MSQSVSERLKAILVDVLMLEDPERVTPDAHLIHDLGAESINIAEITVAIEGEFGLAVPDEALQRATTVESLTRVVEDLLGQKQDA